MGSEGTFKCSNIGRAKVSPYLNDTHAHTHTNKYRSVWLKAKLRDFMRNFK